MMKHTHAKRAAGLAGIALIGVTALTSCGIGKATEPFNDAGVSSQNTSKATTGNMPDGFSNWASKCDHGNRVYSAFKGDAAYGSIAVVPKDPTCVTAGQK